MRFAALVHDLGKAATPPELLPRHIAHEQRGIPLVRALCTRLHAPAAYRELALLATRLHLNVHRALEMKPASVLKLLEQADALRRPERFSALLLVCQADAQGRLGRESTPYPQAAYLEAARTRVAAQSPRDLVAAGLSGKALADRLRERRIAALAALRDSSSNPA
jgi:tRNA nucleotidyltransferase (CCA-adding enzyme)